LRYDLAVDLPATVGGGALWVTSELLKGEIAARACRWCAVDGLDASVRTALRWSNPAAADTTSSVLAFGVVPAAAVGLDLVAAWREGRASQVGVDSLVVAEATVVASDLDQLTKFLVARERPFVHALPQSSKGGTAQPSDNDLSFFSGHTTEAFAVAAAAGTVATMRRYRLAPLVWASGMVLAAATGYLRIAADKHYLTDVLVGAAVGSGVGVSLPLLAHAPAASCPAVVVRPYASPSGIGVMGSF
jgi:membrane-associated phospholipid phosphatase